LIERGKNFKEERENGKLETESQVQNVL
jgi:hypothetical protein